MTLVIGLTGSIASGKSTVSRMFDDFDIPVIDADKLSREVVRPAEKAYKEIVDAFGKQILKEDLTLDREKLGQMVFADAEKRNALNRIVHPAVRERMLTKRDAYVKDGENCVVLDIPLLFESKLSHFADKTLVVYVDETVQLKRLMDRNGYDEGEAMQRINSQIPVKEKAEMADEVIDNNGSKFASYQQLEEILKQWEII